jgi:GT2 family glycosyltransferase
MIVSLTGTEMDTYKYEISVIIVNYKTPHLLYNCVRSIYECSGNLSFEIIIADNNSGDDSKTRIKNSFADVVWIDLTENVGFARANNAGIKKSQGEYILLLNSDTVLEKDAIRKTIDYHKSLEAQKIKTGYVGCKMHDVEGNTLFSSNLSFPGIMKAVRANPVHIFFTRKGEVRKRKKAENKILQHQSTHETKWMGAAFLLFKREMCLRESLFLDEDFFMYGEDVELHNRAVKKNYRNFFFAGTEICHINCGSSSNNVLKSNQIIISDWLCILKTKGKMYYFIYLLQLYINYFFNVALNKKNKSGHTGDRVENTIDRELQNDRELLRKYGFYILKMYNRKPSSNANNLRYVQ